MERRAEYDLLLALAAELSQEPLPDGENCYLARLVLTMEGAPERFTHQASPLRSRLMKIRVDGWTGDRAVVHMDAWLMTADRLAAPRPVAIPPEAASVGSFSAGEILRFARDSGDKNSIHYTENPVVPGMLLLGLVMTPQGKCDLRFHGPVYAEQEICLHSREGGVDGYAHGTLCFSAEIKTRES